jgi:Fe-S-cluster containining protein
MSIKIDLEKLKQDAKLAAVENKAFYARLKRKKFKNLDDKVSDIHYDVFEEIDCLECANCCKTISPVLTDKDIERLAKHLRMKVVDFIGEYTRSDNDGDYVFNSTPCPFLMPDNYCMVYEQRPKACKEYPHTDRRRFHQISEISYNNTHVCPAVFEITERLKKENLK